MGVRVGGSKVWAADAVDISLHPAVGCGYSLSAHWLWLLFRPLLPILPLLLLLLRPSNQLKVPDLLDDTVVGY